MITQERRQGAQGRVAVFWMCSYSSDPSFFLTAHGLQVMQSCVPTWRAMNDGSLSYLAALRHEQKNPYIVPCLELNI